MARQHVVPSGDALAAFMATESLRAATDEQERIEALGLLIYSCAAGAAEVDRLAQSTVTTQGAVVPLLARLLDSGSLHQRKLAGNALLILCFKHSDNAALVGESRAIEAAVANVLAPTSSRPKSGATDESGLALIENDEELVRQISVGVLSNVSAFNPCSHARLVGCGVVQMAVSVLESLLACRIDGAIKKEQLHDKLIAWSVSLLHCLSDNRSIRPALIDAGATAQLLRIAQSPCSGHFPVSATFAVGNLYSHDIEYPREALAPPLSAVHIPETVLRQCVAALPAALRGEVHNGYYFMPDKVALGLRNLLSLSSRCRTVASMRTARRPLTVTTDSSGLLLGIETAFARLHRQEDAERIAETRARHITGNGIWSHAESARVAAAAATDTNVDAHWAIGMPVDAIRAALIDAGALRSLALALNSVGPPSNNADQCGYAGHDKRSPNACVDEQEQEELEARMLHRQTLLEASAAMYELVVGYRSLELDLLHLQYDSNPSVVGLCLLAKVIRPLLQSLRRLAWAKVGQWSSRPTLSLDLVELVTAAFAEMNSRSCQYKASDGTTECVAGATTENSDSGTETDAIIGSQTIVATDASSRLHDAAAERYVCERVQEPGPNYWCSTQTSHHATKTCR